jgi:CubicO group peptidase (beta-lactamase class C family)
LQGEVHDENAWALGGVASHSGLFGDVQSVSNWALYLREAVLNGTRQLSPSVARLFSKRSLPKEKGDWAVGFMMPSAEGSSAGHRFSKSSIGHTGFTGTSFWWDPKADILVVLLSNRVYPTRENASFVKLRAVIHDMIYEELLGGSTRV